MKRFGLIGEHLGHSYSKIIHEKLADYTYDLIPLSKEEFHTFMTNKDFTAINVTIPYKCEVIPYLTHMDQSAASIGAVNAIVNKNGELMGYNTDYAGFLYTLQKHHIKIKGEKVLVLGYGGASKAILAVLRDLEVGELIIANRTVKDQAISFESAIANHSDATVIINTTPVGMYPNMDETPIDLSSFHSLQAVVDIIYNPLETKLMKDARDRNILAVNGLEMLIAQALFAVEHFTNTSINKEEIEHIKEEMQKELAK